MPKHIVRLLLLLAAFAVIAIAAKIYFVPQSFWVYGHYRAKSVAEIANYAPIFKGSQYCQTCHRQEFQEWSTGVHRVSSEHGAHELKHGETYGVNCEDCHGPAGRHPVIGKPPPPVVRHTQQLLMHARYGRVTGKMAVPKNTVALCTRCHEKVPGRPAAQPQIVVGAHAGTQPCITCHNPHTPRIVFPAVPKEMLVSLASAGKAASAQCAGCHGANGTSLSPAFPNLAGQGRAYLVAALEAYKARTRKAPIMNSVAAALSDTEIGNLAAYFSTPARQVPTSVPAVAGADALKARAEACMTCHGDRGISHIPSVPSLAGQKEAYLASALDAYRTGARREALMNRVAHHLSAADVKELAAYYAHLPGAAKPPLRRHAEVHGPDDR
jgi:cytochrome c553